MSNLNTVESEAEDWYKPGKSLQEFHMSKAKRRVLIGGRGCGKTFGSCVEAVNHCWHNAGAEVKIFRKFSSSQEDTVVETLLEVFAKLNGDIDTDANPGLYKDTGRSLFQWRDRGTKIRVPSQDAVIAWSKWIDSNPGASITELEVWLNTTGDRLCGHIILDGLPDDDKAAAKLRSAQVSMLIFVEADAIAEDHIKLAEGSLRKRNAYGEYFPDDEYNIVIETNPPGKKHWLAKWEYGDTENGIPPRENTVFWHIKTEENCHNLRPGYLEDLKETYRYDVCGYNRFVLGLYDDHFPGTAVIKGFSPEIHEKGGLPWPDGAWMIRGWDYGGSNNACVWLAYFVDKFGYEHIWVLKELWLQNSSIEEQANEVKKITEEEFPSLLDKQAVQGLYDFGDIAGQQKSATGAVVNVLATHGIFPGSSVMGLEESLAVFGRLLTARDASNNPVFLIDGDNCPKLTRALKGEYRYPLPGEPGYTAGVMKPLKGPACNHADHIVDAARYAITNMFKLLKVGTNPDRGKRRKKNINPPRIPR
jgi:hypothetical protein